MSNDQLETELQLVEVTKEKTNTEKLQELLDKMNRVLDKVSERKKKTASQ